MEAAKAREDQLAHLIDQFQCEAAKLAVPLDRADKALTEVEAGDLLVELQEKWDSSPVEAVVKEIEPVDGDEAQDKRQSLDSLTESRLFWIDKLSQRLQLHAQFNAQCDTAKNRLTQLKDQSNQLTITPESLQELQVRLCICFKSASICCHLLM